MQTNQIKTGLTDISKLFDEVIMKGDISTAKEILEEIESSYQSFYNRLQNIIILKTKGFILEKDEYIESLNLNEKIGKFLETLRNKFGTYVINEMTVIKTTSDNISPVYFYTLDVEKLNQISEGKILTDTIKSNLLIGMDFFIKNIVQKGIIADGEGTIAGNNIGEDYDIILRVGEYIVGFNNTIESLEGLKIKFRIDQNDIVREVVKFYYEFIN